MFKIGKINSLTILERSDYGLYLGVIDDTPADSPQVKHATEELGDASPTRVLLPNRYCTADMTIGSTLDVFVYNDSEPSCSNDGEADSHGRRICVLASARCQSYRSFP